jgi:hypothetical protein
VLETLFLYNTNVLKVTAFKGRKSYITLLCILAIETAPSFEKTNPPVTKTAARA